MELYIHIPYCKRKCSYCDFLSFDSEGETVPSYFDALKKDIESFPGFMRPEPSVDYGELNTVESIFFGGGTPGLVAPAYIARVMDVIREKFALTSGCEITLETNPCTVTSEKLAVYREAGINRISMGVQSFDDETLNTLGRVHDSADVFTAYEMIRNAGFKNVNIDLISCVPGQGFEGFKTDLEKAVELNPEHLSVYQLIIEPGTPFYEKYGPSSAYERDDDEEAEIFLYTVNRLNEAGLRQYEISNFAKEGYESVHNSGYWTQVSYAGFGAGAAGTIYSTDYKRALRFEKTADLHDYIKNPAAGKRTKLYRQNLFEEYVMLGLRMNKGISRDEIRSRFYGKSKTNIRITPALNSVLKNNPEYIREENGRIFLTTEGMLVSNSIINKII